jgi:hypothetical protein
MIRVRVMGLALALTGSLAATASAQSLDAAAQAARRAWEVHDMATLVAGAARTLIQLPGADPSGPVGRDQAAALLRDYIRGTQEVETVVRTAREVGPGRGFVELIRRYRVVGTQQVRSQSLLLGYVRGNGPWVLAEVRISG